MAVVYRNETSYCGPISMLKRLASGDLVLVFREALWRGFKTHGDPTTRTSFIRSSDNGETWHTHVTPDPAGGNGASVNQLSDGTLIVNNFRWLFVPFSDRDKVSHLPGYGEYEDLAMAGASGGVHITRSTDDGYTWRPAKRLEIAIAEVSTAGRVVELEDGSVLLPLNAPGLDGPSHGCLVMRSTDGGETWHSPAVVAGGNEGLDFAK